MILSENSQSSDRLRNSIDDATPEEWDEVATRNLEIRRKDPNYLCPLEKNGSKDSNPRVEYKFREDELINELKCYIDKTYDQHYAGGKIQATEDIIDDGHGTGFCIGNAKKYLKRYGKKGESPSEWRKDIVKVLHYGLIQLYIHDLEHGNISNQRR